MKAVFLFLLKNFSIFDFLQCFRHVLVHSSQLFAGELFSEFC